MRTDGPPEIEELIDLTGDHREKVYREVEPRIEEGMKAGKGVAASKSPRVRAVIPPLIDRSIQLMRDYLRLIDQLYDRLLLLRDESIRQSFQTLSADVLARAWDDEDDERLQILRSGQTPGSIYGRLRLQGAAGDRGQLAPL